jgi:hypothetical protein
MNIRDIKHEIGYGARTNRYLLEMSFRGLDSVKVSILCKTVDFPPKNIQVQTISKHGRKYNVRGETDYGQSVNMIFYEDSNLSIRRQFDAYLQIVDDSSRFYQLAGKNYEGGNIASKGGVFWHIQNAVDTYKDLFSSVSNIGDTVRTSISEALNGATNSTAHYQTEVNIWSLDNNQNKKYGIQLQNAFISGLSTSPLDGTVNDQILETTVTMTYSEFIPLSGTSTKELLKAFTGLDLGFRSVTNNN